MANLKQRKKALQDIGMYFAEKGKVLTQNEYIDSEDKPVLFSGIRRVFRSYSRMIEMLKRSEPELFELATKKPEVQPKPEVKKEAVKEEVKEQPKEEKKEE